MQRGVQQVAYQLAAARDAAEEELLSDVAMSQSLTAESGTEGFGLENIVGVGLAPRERDGQPTDEPAVSVYVVRKVPMDEIHEAARVPPQYEGVPTDVVESGEFHAFTERGRFRPAPIGVSIGAHEKTTGTLGFLCTHEGDLALVSNNHVLAQVNAGHSGDLIVQPGPADGGGVDDAIAQLGAFHPLDFKGPNLIDAAYALVQRVDVSDQIYGYGPFVPAPLDAQVDMQVWKCGRTTGITHGVLRGIQTTAKLRYGSRIARLREQLIVQSRGAPFSLDGDSGSLVVETTSRRPVGLLCGGGGTLKHTVVNRIENVLQGLGISLDM